MTDNASHPYSAADSAIGYLYQVRIALLWSLQKLQSGLDFAVTIERLDDVTFHKTGGSPAELLQTKHHRTQKANLTDSSPDVWKTLNIWMDFYQSGKITEATSLFLLSTSHAPTGSAMSYLRQINRNVDSALTNLEAAALASQSRANSNAVHKFLSLSKSNRRNLLDLVIIIDSAPHIDDVTHELKRAVFGAADRDVLDNFLQRIESWWYWRVLSHLCGNNDSILSEEIEEELSDLREQFKRDSLPVDHDLMNLVIDEDTQEQYINSIFVKQIDLVNAGKKRIALAILDYYRAFTQRSRWLREELIHIGELTTFENHLKEEWELYFAAVTDELGPRPTEAAKAKAGREILRWAEQSTFSIRPRVTQAFVTRGSFHLLSDKGELGWHPEFREKLKMVLNLEEAK